VLPFNIILPLVALVHVYKLNADDVPILRGFLIFGNIIEYVLLVVFLVIFNNIFWGATPGIADISVTVLQGAEQVVVPVLYVIYDGNAIVK
jgi:hypothetical protein